LGFFCFGFFTDTCFSFFGQPISLLTTPTAIPTSRTAAIGCQRIPAALEIAAGRGTAGAVGGICCGTAVQVWLVHAYPGEQSLFRQQE
jgi:hypothetical protein